MRSTSLRDFIDIVSTSASKTVAFDEGFRSRLNKIYPEFKDDRWQNKLMNRVSGLRVKWGWKAAYISALELRPEKDLAEMFAGKWSLPVIVSLLTLKKRSPEDEKITKRRLNQQNGEIPFVDMILTIRH